MAKDRFEFGENWKRFLKGLSDERIYEAEKSLKEWLGVETLEGKKFLDIGSGSGLFSLAARNLGAEVFSFDYDENSVACTKYLRDTYYKDDEKWQVERGDALSAEYLSKFDKFDVVYSWGVLHHTGNMYLAFENVHNLVADNGSLFISIYNDQGMRSRNWRRVKKCYNKCPKFLRGFILIPCFVVIWTPMVVYDFMKLKPFSTWRNYVESRGMSPWWDVIDWVGGYPFEVASPEEVFEFFHKRGFLLEKMSTAGKGYGCNQFVFKR